MNTPLSYPPDILFCYDMGAHLGSLGYVDLWTNPYFNAFGSSRNIYETIAILALQSKIQNKHVVAARNRLVFIKDPRHWRPSVLGSEWGLGLFEFLKKKPSAKSKNEIFGDLIEKLEAYLERMEEDYKRYNKAYCDAQLELSQLLNLDIDKEDKNQ